jgi:hypothetical protein
LVVLRVAKSHEARLIAIFASAFAGVSKVQIVSDLVDVRRGVFTPPVRRV